MATVLAGKKHQGQTLEDRLNRWCSNAKHCNRLRFLKLNSGSSAASGRLSGANIRV